MTTYHGHEITSAGDTINISTSLPISYSYSFAANVFSPKNNTLAKIYNSFGRVLVIVDENVNEIYGAAAQNYFTANEISATIQPFSVTEDEKSVNNLLAICNAFTSFNLLRREPPLIIGGGLLTDVAGFACAIYRRSTPYVRVPTTLVGLIDASVSNRVAVNWAGLKNRLGAYHEPICTIIDSEFLQSLPEAEIRNGIAEIIKITSCTDEETFGLIQKHGEDLIRAKFFTMDRKSDVEAQQIATQILRRAIMGVLEVEVPNCREANLDRVMFFGHTWSPVLELEATPPLLHGHAISVDMCFSAVLARHLGYITDTALMQFLELFSRLGLSLDHPAFTLDLVKRATILTIATRDGHLRAPIPTGSFGAHAILQDVELDVLSKVWGLLKSIAQSFPRAGLGLDATIDIRILSGHFKEL